MNADRLSDEEVTVEDVCGSLAGPPTAVGAALEQVRHVVHVLTSSTPRSSRQCRRVVTVSVRVTALDAQRCVAGGLGLRRTRARSDRIHSL